MAMKTAAAVRRGLAHQLRGIPCQDEARAAHTGDCAVAAVCDGAGSCPRSEVAARALCGWIVEWLPPRFEELYALEEGALVERVLAEGLRRLDDTGLDRWESSCTLVCAARHRDGRLLVLHVGDGFAFSGQEVLSHPENGRFAEETYFFSSPDAARHLRVLRRVEAGVTAVLLTTDGCGDALYDGEARRPAAAVKKLCDGIAACTEEEVAAALRRNLEEVFAQVSEDDLSLAMLWCGADGPET